MRNIAYLRLDAMKDVQQCLKKLDVRIKISKEGVSARKAIGEISEAVRQHV